MATKTFTSSANIASWDEDRSLTSVPRITPAKVKMNLPDLKATVSSTYTMVYIPSSEDSTKQGNAVFSFTDLVEGDDFSGQSGSFVTVGKGTFDATKFIVKGSFEVVHGSQQGELAKVVGDGSHGSFESDPTNPHKVTYTFNAKA